MSLPNETSWECEVCGVFNIDEGMIRNGVMYCDSCWNEKAKVSPSQKTERKSK